MLSPGIDFNYAAIEGYSAEAAEIMPHAWKAGPQTLLLMKQLEAMDDGGVVIMTVPGNPYRCPPGPYERACMIAHFLKTHKPKSKLVIFDAKPTFSKQPAFEEAFEKYYPGIIELNLTNEIDNFAVVRVDTKDDAGRNQVRHQAQGCGRQRHPAADRRRHRHQDRLRRGRLVPDQAAELHVGQGRRRSTSSAMRPSPPTCPSRLIRPTARARSSPPISSPNSRAAIPRSPATATPAGRCVAADDTIKIGADYTPGEKDGKPLLAPHDPFVSQKGEGPEVRRKNYAESLAWYHAIISDAFNDNTALTHKG